MSNIITQVNEVINKKTTTESKREREICDQINKRANIMQIGQIQLRTIKADVFSSGTTVNTSMAEQRPKNLIKELGIKYIDNLSSNFVYPKINGTVCDFVEETVQITESPTAFDSIRLQPRRLSSYIEYSKEVILNPSTAVQEAIQADLIECIFAKVQHEMFNEIYDESSAMSISDYADICNLEKKASDQAISNAVYLVSPAAAIELKQMKNGYTPIMQNGMINGIRVIETPHLTDNKVILGDFTKLLLGQWGAGIDIIVDNVTKSVDGIIRLTSNTYWNWGKIDDKAFVFATIGE